MTEHNYMNEYLNYLEITGQNANNPQTALAALIRFCEDSEIEYIYLTLVTAEEFQESLLATGNYTKATVLNMVGSVSSFYEYLKSRKIIHTNPFDGVYRLKRSRSLPRNILSVAQMETLLSSLTEFNSTDKMQQRRTLYKAHLVSELMYATGMRLGEVQRLKVEDVDCVNGKIRVTDTKTKRERTAYMGDYCRQILYLYITKMRAYIVTDRQDKTLLFGSARNIGSWLNDILNSKTKELKFSKITTHSFRHSFGVHLLASGCDIRYIKEMLGHASLHTTQVYTRIEKKDLARVVDTYHPRSLHAS